MNMIAFGPWRVIGSEDVAVDNTSGGVALTVATYAGARAAFITVEDQELRWTQDPAAELADDAEGHLADDGDEITLHGLTQIQNFRAIRTGDTDAALHVTYFA